MHVRPVDGGFDVHALVAGGDQLSNAVGGVVGQALDHAEREHGETDVMKTLQLMPKCLTRSSRSGPGRCSVPRSKRDWAYSATRRKQMTVFLSFTSNALDTNSMDHPYKDRAEIGVGRVAPFFLHDLSASAMRGERLKRSHQVEARAQDDDIQLDRCLFFATRPDAPARELVDARRHQVHVVAVEALEYCVVNPTFKEA